jgi:competence protein ComEA
MSENERNGSGFVHDEFGQPDRPDRPDRTIRTARPVAAMARRPSRLNLLIEQVNDRLPVTLQGRWRLDRKTGSALVAAVAIAAVILGGWTLFRARSAQTGQPHLFAAGRPSPTTLAASPVSEAEALASPPPLIADPTGIVVDIEGKVGKPGVLHLPAGSRVMDAITAAGGALPGTDLLPLNQARVLNDGEQLIVGISSTPGSVTVPSALAAHAGSRGKIPPSAPVHLNTATADQLEQLPGVGPALAQRILDWRTQHGRYDSVGELQQVHGLGPTKFGALRQWVEP